MVVLASLGGYIVASLFFLRFPHLLHKKKKLKFKAVHISHRGGAGENCENTLGAFRHALKQRTDMLELDCHLTRDGVVVVSHDPSLFRTCNDPQNIADLNYHELPEYKEQLKVDFDPKTICNSGEDRRIPTLREVFAEFPGIPINIDVKVPDSELNEKVHALIQEYHREDLVIWGNKSSAITDVLYKMNPDVPIMFSITRVLKLLLLFYTGLLPFVPIRESALEVVIPKTVLNLYKNPSDLSWRTKVLIHCADFLLLRPALINHLKRRGIPTFMWVLNEEDQWERAFKLGAAGVMTDFPTRLTQYLDKHPEYRQREIVE